MSYPRLALVFLLCPVLSALRADWKESTGFNRLQQTFTTGVPVTAAGGLSQAEAPEGSNYAPDTTSPLFSGYTFVLKSGDSSASGHAQGVASYFYGNSTSYLTGPASVDLYNANSWLNDGFLRFNTNFFPNIEPRRVQNHSWISNGSVTDEQVTHANLRLDYAINRDGFTSVVGVGNGTSTVLPGLLCQGYHSIAVGLVNGNHSAGFTAFDTAGRLKPDLVAFEGVTSFATPQVAGAAAVLSEKLRLTAYTPALAVADYPRLTKALLLAGAAKEPLASWSRADSTKPYDAVFGAGALNLLLSYRILSAGPAAYSDNTTVPHTAWSIASVGGNQPVNRTRTYFFDIPCGPSVPFSAALVWHRAIDNSLIATLANLDLQLRSVTPDTFTVGSAIDSSTSSVDNVEHLYQPALAPGRYALQVTTGTTSTPYALAWRTSPAVTVATTTLVAREIDSSPAVFTVTRTGPVTTPLWVPLAWSGTAVSGNHYTAPASVLIPAGQSAVTVSATPIPDSLAQGDRTVTLAVATDFSLSAGSPATANATLQDKPYDAWRFTRFTTEDLADPLLSGDSADPDADGVPNLLEYALGAEPKTSDASTHLPVSSLDNDRLTLTYTRPSATTDLTYTVEWSDTLQSWHTGPAFTENLSTTDNGNGTTTVVTRALSPLDTTPRQFLRLRVTRP